MKIVHAADLHLDSPLRGLSRYQGAPVERLRNATRAAMEGLVALCRREQAALLLLAGDLFDGDWRDYATGLFFIEQMARLREANVQVVFVRGNHDFESPIARELRLPDNVHELRAGRPSSERFEALGVAVHGQGFDKREMRDDLASRYPERAAGLFNIGLLHTSLTGRPGHDSYAPTTLEVLRGKGYDYWALGHVHAREVVSTEPYVVYPGNLQGRHARETGDKGATVLTVQDGRVSELRHEPLDVVRWTVCEVDASAASQLDDVVDLGYAALRTALLAADGRLLAARVVITGRSAAHGELARGHGAFVDKLRARVIDLAQDALWLEKVELRTVAPGDPAAIAARGDAIGQLVRSLDALGSDEAQLAGLLELFAELKRKLPDEAKRGADGLRLDDPAYLAELLPEVRELLLATVLQGEGT